MVHSGGVDGALAEYRRRVETNILPFWADDGFDAETGMFRERLDARGVEAAGAPRRAMVQARQIHVFAHAARGGAFPRGGELVQPAIRALRARYCDGGDVSRGFAFSVDRAGRVVSATRDSYAHAFILFALASAYRLTADPALLTMAEETSGFIDRRLADADHGGFFDDGSSRPGGKRQNPLMHMLEAYLAMHEAHPEGPFIDKARRLVTMFVERLYRQPPGVLPEAFRADWTDAESPDAAIFEPGHHFEWTWLLNRFDRISGADHSDVADRLWNTALDHGVSPSGRCYDSVGFDFRPARRSARLWPHAEAVKAAAVRFEVGEPDAAPVLASMLETLNRDFLGRPFAAGWIDHLDGAGAPLVDHVPASSLYHLYGALVEATRVVEPRAPMALLDRDGVINLDVGYPFRPDQIVWTNGVFEALVRLRQAGYRVVVITNQSGVARGLFGEADVEALHRWMAAEIASRGGEISAFYYCPYHPEAAVKAYRLDHPDRKPRPGMILRALERFSTDQSRSFVIGDRHIDVQAARAAGLRGFLFSGGDLDQFVADCLGRL